MKGKDILYIQRGGRGAAGKEDTGDENEGNPGQSRHRQNLTS